MRIIRRCCRVFLILLFGMIVGCEAPAPVNGNDPVHQVNRKIGYHITNAEGQDYDAAVATALALEMDVVPFTMVWSDFETAEGYDSETLGIINVYYPVYQLPLSLNITPINAVYKAFPEDIASESFSNPQVIIRFKAFLDAVHQSIPDVSLNNILFGNEVDLYLASHPDEWDDFETFYAAAVEHANTLWEGVPVGVESTYGTLTGAYAPEMRGINEHSDFIAFTFYPLEGDFTMKDPGVFGTMLDDVAASYPEKPLFLEETGYATSSVCDGTEEDQAEYISAVFKAWDKHADRLSFVGFLWLHDLSRADAEFYLGPYGMDGSTGQEVFVEYLRTLGLYAYQGTEKQAVRRLKEELAARGW